MPHPATGEEFLSWLMDSFGLSVAIDEDERVCLISRAYSDILGIPQDRAVGMPVEKLIPNTRLPEVFRSGAADYGSVHILPNGIPVIINRLPIVDHSGRVRGAISVPSVSDAAAFKNMSDTVERLRRSNCLYREQLDALAGESPLFDSMIGGSPAMRRIRSTIGKIADVDLSVLITGETGTGKEIAASALHMNSGRRDNRYVKINCAAIPKELMESELFGYADGAFSGAAKGGKAGKFELADNGTILLDEVGEIPLELQAKLLRILQEREVERIGDVRPRPLNIRVICSTNRDLGLLAARGEFRQDLYYRINVIELKMPPLRERREDIPELCEHFIGKINELHGCFINGVNPDVMAFFEQYAWPGNVRQLEHVLEGAGVMTRSGMLHMGHFEYLAPPEEAGAAGKRPGATLRQRKGELERAAILSALNAAGGGKAEAARMLGMSRSRLYVKIEQYGITRSGSMFS